MFPMAYFSLYISGKSSLKSPGQVSSGQGLLGYMDWLRSLPVRCDRWPSSSRTPPRIFSSVGCAIEPLPPSLRPNRPGGFEAPVRELQPWFILGKMVVPSTGQLVPTFSCHPMRGPGRSWPSPTPGSAVRWTGKRGTYWARGRTRLNWWRSRHSRQRFGADHLCKKFNNLLNLFCL